MVINNRDKLKFSEMHPFKGPNPASHVHLIIEKVESRRNGPESVCSPTRFQVMGLTRPRLWTYTYTNT